MQIGHSAFSRLCRARELLRPDREPTLSVAAVAAEIGLSQFHFIRQFRALFGVTPHQFRTEARLDRAKELLASGQKSVTDVCLELGFSSLGSFSDLFSRRVGSPPSRWHQARADEPASPIPGCLGMLAGLPAAAFRNSREA